MSDIRIHEVVKEWEAASKLDLCSIVDEVRNISGMRDMPISFSPSWPGQTASIEEAGGLSIFLEYPLFFNPKISTAILRNNLIFLVNHEMNHIKKKSFALGEWFRYEVLKLPFALDISTEGVKHSVDMTIKDIEIDTPDVRSNKNIRQGYFNTLTVGALEDQTEINRLWIKKTSEGKYKFNSNPDSIIFWIIRNGRRNSPIINIKKEIELTPQEKSQAIFMDAQFERLVGKLRYPELSQIAIDTYRQFKASTNNGVSVDRICKNLEDLRLLLYQNADERKMEILKRSGIVAS